MRKFSFIIVLLSTLGIVVYGNWNIKIGELEEDREAIELALLWGGLSNLPVSFQVLRVEKKGGPFTRQFIIEFQADSDEIIDWLKNSKRIEVKPELDIKKRSIYNIYPGEEGATGGNIEIDWLQNIVVIDMSWS